MGADDENLIIDIIGGSEKASQAEGGQRVIVACVNQDIRGNLIDRTVDLGPEERQGAACGHRYGKQIPFGLVLLYEGTDIDYVGTTFFLFHCVRKSVKLARGVMMKGGLLHCQGDNQGCYHR